MLKRTSLRGRSWSGSHQRLVSGVVLRGAVVGVLAATSGLALGGTRRDDVPDSQYLALGNDPRYASVGKLLWSEDAAGASSARGR